MRLSEHTLHRPRLVWCLRELAHTDQTASVQSSPPGLDTAAWLPVQAPPRPDRGPVSAGIFVAAWYHLHRSELLTSVHQPSFAAPARAPMKFLRHAVFVFSRQASCVGAAGAMEHWDRIEVCRHADGSAWVLGEGRFGKVHPLLRSSHFCCQLIHMLVAAAKHAICLTCWGVLQAQQCAAAYCFADSHPLRILITCQNTLQNHHASQTACALRCTKEC